MFSTQLIRLTFLIRWVFLNKHKAIGNDGVSAEVLKSSLTVTIFILTELLNLCLLHGWCPKFLKDANFYPLHKSGDILKIKNYKMISILPANGKVFE